MKVYVQPYLEHPNGPGLFLSDGKLYQNVFIMYFRPRLMNLTIFLKIRDSDLKSMFKDKSEKLVYYGQAKTFEEVQLLIEEFLI